MRTEAEILAMVAKLEKYNSIIAKNMRELEGDGLFGGTLDELLATFNHNGLLLCALRWTLGEDTISDSEARGTQAKAGA